MRADHEPTYQLADFCVQSSVPLPELRPAEGGAAEHWRFTVSRATPSRRLAARWFQHWYEADGRRCLSFARTADGYCLRFHRGGDFQIVPLTHTIACIAPPEVADRTIRHLLLNQVVPLLATRRRLVLHASAIRRPAGVTGLVGPGGAGKSTLAAALCRRGARLVTDDALMLSRQRDGFTAIPTYGEIRLWPESLERVGHDLRSDELTPYSSKRRIEALFGFERTHAPLAHVCVLAGSVDRPTVALERLGPREALSALLPCTFQLDVADAARIEETFDRLTALVRRVPVYRLRYPWALDGIAEVAERVWRALERAPQATLAI
jgi:hypothetical protein